MMMTMMMTVIIVSNDLTVAMMRTMYEADADDPADD